MATTLNSNLFPPIVDTFTPSFLYSKSCRVYFSLSSYNSIQDISGVQMLVTVQNSNNSALSQTRYPAGIVTFPIGEVKVDDNIPGQYYIEISPGDLREGFVPGTYYKVQFRFASSEAVNIESVSGQNIELTVAQKWIIENQNKLSEWSVATLIKPISEFTLNLNTASFDAGSKITPNIVVNDFSDIEGVLSFHEKEESEVLEEYRIRIYEDKYKTVLLLDSDIQSPISTNTIKYMIEHFFENGSYFLQLDITTNNGYKETFNATIRVALSENKFNGSLQAIMQPEKGRVKIIYIPDKDTEEEIITGTNIVIRRSAVSPYVDGWTDLFSIVVDKNITYDNPLIKYDYLIEDGIFYNYKIQERDIDGKRSSLYPQSLTPTLQGVSLLSIWDYVNQEITYQQVEKWLDGSLDKKEAAAIQKLYSTSEMTSDVIVRGIIDDSFLCGDYKYLKIKFDSNVSSYKRKRSDAMIETLGSKYPFFKRNGDMDYRTFEISGVISFNMDLYEQNFISDSITRGKEESLSTMDYREDDEKSLFIDDMDNMFYDLDGEPLDAKVTFAKERIFREKVIDFLNNGNAKLWKSPSEGNIIVQLTEVGFSPKQELGRMLYDFSATATEIADYNVSNCDMYNIQDIGDYLLPETEDNSYLSSNIKTIVGQYTVNSDLVDYNFIEYLRDKYDFKNIVLGNTWEFDKISWLRIRSSNLNYTNPNGTDKFRIENDKEFVLYRNGYEAWDVDITTLILNLKAASNLYIDYCVTFHKKKDLIEYKTRSNKYIVGQLYQTFEPKTSIFNILYNKYYLENEDGYRLLNTWNKAYFTFNNEDNIISDYTYKYIDIEEGKEEEAAKLSKENFIAAYVKTQTIEGGSIFDDRYKDGGIFQGDYYLLVKDSEDELYHKHRLWRNKKLALDDFQDDITLRDVQCLGFQFKPPKEIYWDYYADFSDADKYAKNGNFFYVYLGYLPGYVQDNNLIIPKEEIVFEPEPKGMTEGKTPKGEEWVELTVESGLPQNNSRADWDPNDPTWYFMSETETETVEERIRVFKGQDSKDYANGNRYTNYIRGNYAPYVKINDKIYRILEIDGELFIVISLTGVVDYYCMVERGLYK